MGARLVRRIQKLSQLQTGRLGPMLPRGVMGVNITLVRERSASSYPIPKQSSHAPVVESVPHQQGHLAAPLPLVPPLALPRPRPDVDAVRLAADDGGVPGVLLLAGCGKSI